MPEGRLGLTRQINQNHELLKPHSRELSEDLVESKVQEIEIKGEDERARWGEGGKGGRQRRWKQQAWQTSSHPLQAEAPGSTKVMQVTWLGLAQVPFRNSHGPHRKGTTLVPRETYSEGRRVCSLCCTRPAPCGLSPAHGKHAPTGVFVTG